MRDEYDFTDAVKNPHVRRGKTVVTIRLDSAVLDYFKDLATKTGIPYQTLINSCLADCAVNRRSPDSCWKDAPVQPQPDQAADRTGA